MFDSARLSGRSTGIATAVSLFVFALVLSAPVALGCGDAGCSPGTYSGRAYGAWIHTGLSGDTTVADTGDLPPEGGVLDATFDHLDTPVATATLFFSVTSGLNGVAASAASTSYVTLVPGDGVPLVTSTFAFAWTSATCDYVLGASEVAGLYVMGKEVLVTNEANQIVDVPGVLTLK
ncbi:MAG TPA: choice-of-anchor P family protein, partial [Thermoplasmata archaeon]|nr:choice-of-anchor P family protein [Thermoplasmata archaeon]